MLSLSKYNAHSDVLFKKMKLLKISDILKLHQLKFYYKYKNNKLPLNLQALPLHPNTRTYDHNTCIKHNIHHPIAKHIFAKSCVCFGIPRIVNYCPNSILEKINTYSLHSFSVYIKYIFGNHTKKIPLWWTVM